MTTSKVTAHPSAVAGGGRSAELDLVDRCRRGELGAFEELYRAHSGRLYSLASRMLGNPADAEDQLRGSSRPPTRSSRASGANPRSGHGCNGRARNPRPASGASPPPPPRRVPTV